MRRALARAGGDSGSVTTRIRRLVATFGWWQWLLTGVLVVALVLGGIFTLRTVRYAVYWSQHRDEPIERWMTVNYVAHSYSVPPDVLRDALGLAAPQGRLLDRRPLHEVAGSRGLTFEQARALLEAAIALEREERPPGEPPSRPSPPPPSGTGRPAS